MKISWTRALVGLVVVLLAVVGYFLKGQNDKLDLIYASTLSLPEDVKRIKEAELPKISQRLDDHRAILVALASTRGDSSSPEVEKLLENLLKRIVKIEFDKIHAVIASLEKGQSAFQKDVTRLSELIDRQNKFAVASSFLAHIPPERLMTLKLGDTITLPAYPTITYSVTNPREFSSAVREVTRTYRSLGIEATKIEPKLKAPAPETPPQK